MLKNKQIQIIGLTGLAGHGKTEACDLLVNLTGFKKMAFGDAVKRAAAGIYNLDVRYFYEGQNIDRNTTIINPYGLTIRQMMRKVGDAMKNQEGGSFWIDIIKYQIELESDDDKLRGVIVEDIRYDHDNPWGIAGDESAAVRSWGGKIFHVDAGKRIGRKEVHETHCSEKGVTVLADDVVIDNNGDLQCLRGTIDEVVKHFDLIKL